MDNHYHLLIETPKANLSQLMRGLNGRYTRYFNKTYKRMGHLFQGRYKAVIAQKDTYLLELSRYIVLNPVRAGMLDNPEGYPWSSYRACIGQSPCPDWLAAVKKVAQVSMVTRTEPVLAINRMLSIQRQFWNTIKPINSLHLNK